MSRKPMHIQTSIVHILRMYAHVKIRLMQDLVNHQPWLEVPMVVVVGTPLVRYMLSAQQGCLSIYETSTSKCCDRKGERTALIYVKYGDYVRSVSDHERCTQLSPIRPWSASSQTGWTVRQKRMQRQAATSADRKSTRLNSSHSSVSRMPSSA